MRIGIDLGGTKIEAIALADDGKALLRRRVPTPAGDYRAILDAVASLVAATEKELGRDGSIGIACPGAISATTGLIKNSNTTVLIGKPLDRDLATRLGQPVRLENDANCFTLSEAVDGAGTHGRVVFGVILGTGCGGGIVVNGKVIAGRNRVTGEWGHTPLPWPKPEELPGAECWCGHHGCLETWIAGPALAADTDGAGARDAHLIPARARAGEQKAKAALERHADRVARGLAVVVDILDPDVIVLGGGLSNMDHLYSEVPKLMTPYVFSDFVHTPVVRNAHGDSSGVRGAAWLWPSPGG